MRGKGICYDTGFFHLGSSTREPFDPEVVAEELRIIHDDLHCTAVRITGGDPERLKLAADHAAEAGLEVWLCPFTTDLTEDEMLQLLADLAEHAERLRAKGTPIVVCTGSEIAIANRGFVPGDTFLERTERGFVPEVLRRLPERVNAFSTRAVAVVRERFHGPVSYASLPYEGVDWTPFDIIATDTGYRSEEMAEQYAANIRAFVEHGRAMGKPVAITEFGCGTYRGAVEAGPRGGDVIRWDLETGQAIELVHEYVRDEQAHAAFLQEAYGILDKEGVDSAFAYVFATYHLPHRGGPGADPRQDFDLASFGVVKVLADGHGTAFPGMRWEPKVAFSALAETYAEDQRPARQ